MAQQKSKGGAAAKARAPRGGRRRGGSGQSQQQQHQAESSGQVAVNQESEWSYAWPGSPWPTQDATWWNGLAQGAVASPWAVAAVGTPTAVPANNNVKAAVPAELLDEKPNNDNAADGTREVPAPADAEESDAAAATHLLLDALAPGGQSPVEGAEKGGQEPRAPAKRSSWLVASERPLTETAHGLLGPEQLLGHWVDSQHNSVHVLSTDAYEMRLEATLSRPPRPDIHLSVKPVMLGAGWQCGHSLLDPMWTNPRQLHWVAMDGRVSVWVRPQENISGTSVQQQVQSSDNFPMEDDGAGSKVAGSTS